MRRRTPVLMLLTYAVRSSLALIVARALREAGIPVAIAYYATAKGIYTADPLDDFKATDDVIDLTEFSPLGYSEIVERAVHERNVGLIIQVGCEPLYPLLPYLKERKSDLAVVDLLFNEAGHTVSHFLFEPCIDATLVESQHMKAYIERCSGLARPVVHVVESGVDLERFAPGARPARSTALAISFIGRMSPEKNPLGFVELAEQLAERNPDLVFKLFGEGVMSAEVREKIERSPFTDRILFMGFVDDATQALAETDVLIVPSVLDGRPGIIMEANACGVPVIGTPVGGIPEMITEGVNGHLCRLAERERIAGILDGYLRAPESLAEARRRARETAEHRFDRRQMIAAYAQAARQYLREEQPA